MFIQTLLPGKFYILKLEFHKHRKRLLLVFCGANNLTGSIFLFRISTDYSKIYCLKKKDIQKNTTQHYILFLSSNKRITFFERH